MAAVSTACSQRYTSGYRGTEPSVLNSGFGYGLQRCKRLFPILFLGCFVERCFSLGCHRSWLIFWLAFVSRQGCELLEVGTLRCGPFTQPLLKTAC